MSLFDLQDVCIAIGSIATLDLPMVVDLIVIYGLKGPYCMLTTTNWFLQALSVIPRGSWGDVARRFTMIRWADHCIEFRKLSRSIRSDRRSELRRPLLSQTPPPPPPPPRVAGIRSGQFDEENPFVQNLSVLLVQADKGVSVLVVDRIGDIYRSLPRRADVIVTTVGARHKCQQGSGFEPPIVSMTFRVVRTNQYNQDLGLIHSTNGNHLESPNEGSSIDHQVTIYLHAQNITMLPTNETWYFASQILVSNSGGLILILTAQSTRNMFRIHSDY
ncbi:hypothetical protein F511_16473 [Dorcoceras hygrometricum]|uniref:Uncharacterized protein n=1 Tax=Dorcoceras hygrometricum TaxID=472368 RepID=A0A2Z7D7B7_9LAMI|nr:hypothetical protein F511_16473 [Dorcoceras hygrometricum]